MDDFSRKNIVPVYDQRVTLSTTWSASTSIFACIALPSGRGALSGVSSTTLDYSFFMSNTFLEKFRVIDSDLLSM